MTTRIASRFLLQILFQGLPQIDSRLIGQADQHKQYVRHFIPQIARSGSFFETLFSVGSVEQASQFTDFFDQLGQIGQFGKVRMLGSAALMLCYVASGRCDSYWERQIRLWDVAAGLAIVVSAGGQFKLGDISEDFKVDVEAACAASLFASRIYDN